MCIGQEFFHCLTGRQALCQAVIYFCIHWLPFQKCPVKLRRCKQPHCLIPVILCKTRKLEHISKLSHGALHRRGCDFYIIWNTELAAVRYQIDHTVDLLAFFPFSGIKDQLYVLRLSDKIMRLDLKQVSVIIYHCLHSLIIYRLHIQYPLILGACFYIQL